MVRICIRMLRIAFKWFEFGFEFFEYFSNGSNLHSNASNPFRMVLLRIPFKWLEFGFKCFESLSNGLNLDLNASNPFQVVRICIRMLRITFEWFKFGIESLLSGLNLHSNALNPLRVVPIDGENIRFEVGWSATSACHSILKQYQYASKMAYLNVCTYCEQRCVVVNIMWYNNNTESVTDKLVFWKHFTLATCRSLLREHTGSGIDCVQYFHIQLGTQMCTVAT